MGSWKELLDEFNNLPEAGKDGWWASQQRASLEKIGLLRQDREVLLYGSAFLQKPTAPAFSVSIGAEDLNGLMAVVYQMDCSKGLTILLHTPGGSTNACETVVEYLRSKFDYIEVIVPAYAMSAGTMISLAADRVIMGRQSQLGPIDPQISTGSMTMSARAVVDQFRTARKDILGDGTTPANPGAAHLWAPILQSAGPSLLQEAQNALDYGERMVAGWLGKYMLSGHPNPHDKALEIAKYFNDAGEHKSHGRRIGRDEARGAEVVVEDLEDSQELQEAVLTSYHLATIAFDSGPLTKMLYASTGQMWARNLNIGAPPVPATPQAPGRTVQPVPRKRQR